MTDITVLVRYPDYTRRAVIRQSRQSAFNRRHTKNGRPYAQMWHVVKWIDEEEIWKTKSTNANSEYGK